MANLSRVLSAFAAALLVAAVLYIFVIAPMFGLTVGLWGLVVIVLIVIVPIIYAVFSGAKGLLNLKKNATIITLSDFDNSSIFNSSFGFYYV